ncbi:MAG: peptidylprolyl isomerase, partial [Paludibacteraceae bacterium]|nr:peptidylprolyl isomerase [Paludibacteraceae bacterium]
MKKNILTYFILSIISTFATAQNNLIDGIVWVVGDEVILRSEVEEQTIRMQYEGQKVQGDLYCTIPEQMAIQKLFLHQAKIESIVVAESMVVSQV